MGKGINKEIQKFLLMLVLVVLMVVVAVIYLYLPLVEDKEALVEENVALNTEWIELQNMARDTEIFKERINASKTEISKVLSRCGAGNTPEKSIVLVNRMEDEIGVKIPNVSFSTPTILTSVQTPMIQEAEDGTYSIQYSNINLLTETLTMSYSATYDQLKQLVDFVNVSSERMNIKSVSISYDTETGDLNGTLVLNLYAVTGTDKQYTEPKVEDIRLGEENIFAQ